MAAALVIAGKSVLNICSGFFGQFRPAKFAVDVKPAAIVGFAFVLLKL